MDPSDAGPSAVGPSDAEHIESKFRKNLMYLYKMTTRHIGGKRRRQRGGVSDGALADATNSIVKALQNGGRKRTYRKKGGKKSKRSGG